MTPQGKTVTSVASANSDTKPGQPVREIDTKAWAEKVQRECAGRPDPASTHEVLVRTHGL